MMEIKKENKFKNFFKRFGKLTLVVALALGVALTIGLSVSLTGKGQEVDQPASTGQLEFGLPMKECSVVKDYADDHLQYNDTLNQWEIHLAVDLVSENNEVCSVLDGVVTAIVEAEDSLEGYVVEITHDGGFVSVYSSLDKELQVSLNDKVSKGQTIGKTSSSASNELKSGNHLHFAMFKNNEEVDPNNYLDLQNNK